MGRILVVDDDKSIRNTLKRFIINDGHTAQAVGDPIEALALFRQYNFDAIITDIVMPQITGMELLKVFSMSAPHIPIVLMTGTPTFETDFRSARAGAFAYLIKPVSKEEVLETLREALTLK